MNANPTFSVVFITMNRHEELIDIIKQVAEILPLGSEIILVDNNSDEPIKKANRQSLVGIDALLIIENDTNAGVSGGRNIGLSAATRDIIIELDDDAVLGEVDIFQKVATTFGNHPEVGIVAFRIVNYFTKQINRIEYPFKNKRRDPLKPGLAPTFIGCGHAFRREVIEMVGVYRDFAPWGSEEADYSLRTLDANFEIYYEPNILVYHKKSPKARIKDPVEFGAIALKNRLKVALLNLPWFAVVTYFLVRIPHFVWKTRSVRTIGLMLVKLKADWSYVRENRRPVSRKTFWKVSRLGGQAWF